MQPCRASGTECPALWLAAAPCSWQPGLSPRCKTTQPSFPAPGPRVPSTTMNEILQREGGGCGTRHQPLCPGDASPGKKPRSLPIAGTALPQPRPAAALGEGGICSARFRSACADCLAGLQGCKRCKSNPRGALNACGCWRQGGGCSVISA